MQEEKFNKQDGNLDQPNVNESLALAGLFRKVSADERMPNKTGLYHTNRGMTNYFHGLKKFEHDPHIDYWLEEIELPSEEDIERKGDEYGVRHGWRSESYDSSNDVGIAFERGATWVRSLAVTAKDNVR